MKNPKRSSNPRDLFREAGAGSHALTYQDSFGTSETKKLSSMTMINRPVFSRGAVISWGRSIGLTPEIALGFMQSEGVVLIDSLPVLKLFDGFRIGRRR